jgi:hypothetical protein
VVGPIDHPVFSHEISVDHILAHDEEGLVERLVKLLEATPGITKVAREDRELVLVAAPGRSADAVERLVATAWDQAHGQTSSIAPNRDHRQAE